MHIRNTILALAMIACGALTASPAAPPAAPPAKAPPTQTDEQPGMAEAGQRWASQGVKVGAYLDKVLAQ